VVEDFSHVIVFRNIVVAIELCKFALNANLKFLWVSQLLLIAYLAQSTREEANDDKFLVLPAVEFLDVVHRKKELEVITPLPIYVVHQRGGLELPQ